MDGFLGCCTLNCRGLSFLSFLTDPWTLLFPSHQMYPLVVLCFHPVSCNFCAVLEAKCFWQSLMIYCVYSPAGRTTLVAIHKYRRPNNGIVRGVGRRTSNNKHGKRRWIMCVKPEGSRGFGPRDLNCMPLYTLCV